MEFFVWDLGYVEGDAVVEVSINLACNVFLLTADDFEAYKTDQGYRYVGGYYDASPLSVQTPHDDYWFVVLDNYDGQIASSVTVRSE